VPPPADEVTVEAVYQGGSTSLAEVSSSAVTVTPGRLYLAVVSTKSHRSVQSVTGLGGSWALVDEQCAGRSQTGLTVYSTTSASSSGPVTAVLDGTPANAVIAVIEYAGADSAAPLGSPVSANTVGFDGACSGGVDGESYSVPVTTATSNSLVSSFVAIRNRRHTPGAGFTEILEVSQGSGGNTVGLAAQTQLVPIPDTVNSGGTTSSTVDWAVVAVEIRSEVRAQRDRLTRLHQLAEHYRGVVIPLRERIVVLTEEEYNFMLTGVFELLMAKRDEYAAYQEYIESVRDYWQTWAALERAVGYSLENSPGEAIVPSIELPAQHHNHEESGS